MDEIKFGTDGWRAVIAEDFTFSNVERVSQAIADYFLSRRAKEKGMAVGYDTRFLSPQFARRVSEVLLGNGIPVFFSSSDLPTQCLSFWVKRRNLAGGVILTASHNPPRFNGIKIKASFGGAALPEQTREVERLLDKSKPKKMEWEKAKKKGLLRIEDMISPYLEKVKSFLDLKLINKAELSIVYDPMFGVGTSLLERLLENSNCKIFTLHPKYNPGFGGINPEPIEENLEELKKTVKEKGASLGLATDGDADRVGVVDEKGRWFTPHEIFSLLLLWLVEKRGLKGGVAKTVSLGFQPERICKKFGLPLYHTPVGFKYITELMLKEDILLGGEESGGYGYRGHILERDGILSSLLFVEMLSGTPKTLSELLEQLEKRFGRSFFKRVDFELEGVEKKRMVNNLLNSPPSFLGGKKISHTLTLDGVKFICEDDAWLLIRPSGTEPKVRVYAESTDPKSLKEIVNEGVKLARKAV